MVYTFVAGGQSLDEPADADASFAKKRSLPGPYVLTGVTKEMDLHDTESFGPLMAYGKFETEKEAIDLANDTQYGLAAAVWTKDLAKGLRVAQEITSGYV